VEKGMQQGHKIVFEGQADEAVSRNYYFFPVREMWFIILLLSKDGQKLMILSLLHGLPEVDDFESSSQFVS